MKTKLKFNFLSDLGSLDPFCKSVVWNIGVLFDSDLKFDKHIYSVVISCFYHLRLIAKVKPFLSMHDLEKVIHAFVFTRLDYSSSLIVGINHCITAYNWFKMLQRGFWQVLIRKIILPIPYRINCKKKLIWSINHYIVGLYCTWWNWLRKMRQNDL